MGKLMRYLLNMILASILVWSVTIMAFTDEIVFNQPGSTGVESIDTSDLSNGTYVGTGDGFAGPIEVEVIVKNGEITEINVLSHNETDGVSDPAFDDIPTAIVDNNSADVDAVSGATGTSNGLMEAVNNALSGTASQTSESEEEPEEEAEEEPVATIDISDVADGTYSATVDGHNGDLEVEVVVEGSAIMDVVVTNHVETEGLSDPAIEEVPAAIVENNSTEVDTVSGATVTSEAIINAVNTALENAQ